jgi:hypothetical protein
MLRNVRIVMQYKAASSEVAFGFLSDVCVRMAQCGVQI